MSFSIFSPPVYDPVAIPVPAWQILYQGSDITNSVAQTLERIEYEENIGSEKANTIRLYFADNAQRLQNGPFQKGEQITLLLGWKGAPLIKCGTFEIDEEELEGPPDIYRIGAIQAGFSQAVRTQNAVAYEGKTLLQIASQIAAKYGFTVVGDAVNPDVPYERLTQNLEPDLAFLRRIANMHNYDFNVRDNQLIFYSREALDAANPIGLIQRNNVVHFRFREQTLANEKNDQPTFAAAQVVYFDPKSKGLVYGLSNDSDIIAKDHLKAVERIENPQQATLRAKGYLHQSNMLRCEGQVVVPGTLSWRAGNTIDVQGFGKFDQFTYMIERARHELTPEGGWISEFYLRNTVVGDVNKISKHYIPPPPTPQNPLTGPTPIIQPFISIVTP